MIPKQISVLAFQISLLAYSKKEINIVLLELQHDYTSSIIIFEIYSRRDFTGAVE